MTTLSLSEKFLSEHKMRAIDINIQNIIDLFTLDMLNGLAGKESHSADDPDLYRS